MNWCNWNGPQNKCIFVTIVGTFFAEYIENVNTFGIDKWLNEFIFVRNLYNIIIALRRFLKILRYTAASLLLLLVLLVALVNLTPVQNYLAGKAAAILSDKLKTKVEIKHIRIDFLNHILIQGVYIEDQSKDTLLYAGEASVRITDWFIFKDNPVLKYIGLKDAYVHLHRPATSDAWNYQYIADALSSGKKSSGKSSSVEFDLQKTELENVRVHMDDSWVGEDLNFDIGIASIKTKGLDFKRKQLTINDITFKNSGVSVKEYKGGRPPKAKKGPQWEDLVHKTPFNPGNWIVKIKDISLHTCSFRLTSDDVEPALGHFDQTHLAIKDIQFSASDINIKGDTLHGNINNLSAQDRCGIAIKTMRSKVTVSPNASICEDLYLETNFSKVQNYYAMRYRHFPDFNSYIDSVTMEAHLEDAIIDERDIAFFAPQLREFPGVILKVNGKGKGTVADLNAQNLTVTDGSSTIRGNVSMKGLPDIYTTHIGFTNGELMTSGKGILRYAPMLKNDTDIAMDHILYAYFKGSYDGFIENFSLDGALNTNLGGITTKFKMNIPGFDPNMAEYSGSVTATNVQIGDFLKQPILGNVSLSEDFSGKSFNPDEAQLNIDGKVTELGLNNYNYQNITTHGLVAKKQFTGTLLVDDPNLALEFDGGINYSNKNLLIKATAHLLGCNFSALKLTKDTVTLTADFDLNCTGYNIDNFTGYAKLNNIDLKRNLHRLAVDSVQVQTTGDTLHRLIMINSNDVTATIKGNYQLSKLPASVQYYLSRYIPNYIPEPSKYAPNQNIEFSLTTRDVDSIFALTLPIIRGFDSSVFSGSLNTSSKKLTLDATVPHASVGKFHMNNVSLTGLGNFNGLALTTTVDNVAIGDSIVNGSLSLTTTVAHDSVNFTIATTAPDTSSSLTLNGRVVARKDSLLLTVFPSQFYLNQTRWSIAGGSKIVYADKYLSVNGVSLTSGLQKVTAQTDLTTTGVNMLVTTEKLDLGQLGIFAGLATYQPDGRMSGTVKIDNLFGDMLVTTNIRAKDVKFGTDTLGDVNIIGSYNAAKQLINLDPQTGIFRNGASVIASGNISFDSATHQQLNGTIEFKNAPVVWASPFLTGIMSRLSGTVNGKVGFKGSSYEPVLDGSLNLFNAAFRLDYMGTNYTVPFATVAINNRRIEFGKVMIFDRWHNFAFLTGHFSHNLFKRMRMHLKVQTDKFEAMNLASYDNNLFYGNAIVSMDSLTLRGPFDSLRLNIYNLEPAAKSTVYMPATSGTDAGTYSYVSFKDYGKNVDKIVQKHKNKFSINIDAHLNTLAEMVLVLDPTNGDEIRARGDGYITMDIPPNNDMSMYGTYTIDYGTYTFTFNQLFIRRSFQIDPGSTITFNNEFAKTDLNVNATYRVKAKLSDLLSENEKRYLQDAELTDAQTPQWVNIALRMTGYINALKLTFNLDLEDKHSQNSTAYQKLRYINTDARQQFNQVGALLLVGQFVQPEGIGTGAAISGAVNNISQIISNTASTGLTAIINKLTGDKDLNVAVKYTNYNYADQSLSGNRNELKIGVNKSLFKDKLIVEVGSTSDWGRPTSASSSSNFNFTGDFRAQYKINKMGSLRLNAFRTSDYDVTLDRDIIRSGVGIAWKKSFDNLGDFFHGRRYAQRMKDRGTQNATDPIMDTLSKPAPQKR